QPRGGAALGSITRHDASTRHDGVAPVPGPVHLPPGSTSLKPERAESAALAKPRNPAGLQRGSWPYLLRRTVREFFKDQCIDLAAGLTYYTMLALVPAMVAVVSLVGLIGEGPETSSEERRVGKGGRW